MGDYDSITIEFETTPGGMTSRWKVYGHGIYPESSVLAGQLRRVYLDEFKTAEEAQERYPSAVVVSYSTRSIRYGSESLAELSGLPSEPPEWFDALDAGEHWTNDY